MCDLKLKIWQKIEVGLYHLSILMKVPNVASIQNTNVEE
jgi:hypothetical protein